MKIRIDCMRSTIRKRRTEKYKSRQEKKSGFDELKGYEDCFIISEMRLM